MKRLLTVASVIIIIMIFMASWKCHWDIIPKKYNIGLAGRFSQSQRKIHEQGLFSFQFSLKKFHISLIRFLFRFWSAKSILLCIMVIRSPVRLQKLLFCTSYRSSGIFNRLRLSIPRILYNVEKSTSYL